MKKLIVSAVCIVMLIGCRKEYKVPSTSHQIPEEFSQDIPKCGVDLHPEFTAKIMKARQARDQQEKINERKPKDIPDPASAPTIIYLDANGHTVSNTLWNFGGTFVCEDAGLTEHQLTSIITSVTEDFSTFQVIVTSDESLYLSTAKEKRIRVIITRYQSLHDIFPPAGGYAIIGSLWFGDDTPCFVFADGFVWNTANIAEAVSHEAGHTIGLGHQSEFSFDGRYLFEYHRGFFSAPWNLFWKPIMGGSYNGDISGWMLGRNLNGAQDDTELLSAVGVKADESSSTATELKFNGSLKRVVFNGLMNRRSDSDYYMVKDGNVKFFIIGGGNCDLQVDVYDSNEQLMVQYNDQSGLGISEKTIQTKSNKIFLKVTANSLLIGNTYSEMQFAGQYTLVVEKI